MDSTKIKSLQDFTSHDPPDADRKRTLSDDIAAYNSSLLRNIVWPSVIYFIVAHLAALYAVYLTIFKAKGLTILFGEYLHYTVTVILGRVAQLV